MEKNGNTRKEERQGSYRYTTWEKERGMIVAGYWGKIEIQNLQKDRKNG